MFGDEWARERTFPNTVVGDGETVTFDGVGFTVIDLGPSESQHDSPWFLAEWLANIESLRERFPADAVFHVGHGGPLGQADWDWQMHYITTFVDAVERADWTDPGAAHALVVAAMRKYLPTDDLVFLMELSIDPVATQMRSSHQAMRR